MAKANRLKLDFSIELAADREKFIEQYLNEPEFCVKPPTQQELETISNYILWGKDQDGETVVSRGLVELETKNGNWTKKHSDESLDALLETPTFNEDCIMRPHQAHYKNVKETFSREIALNTAPESMKEIFMDLFRRIDETELEINLYEVRIGKRDKPPRKELYKLLSEEEVSRAQSIADELEQYGYLKKRHYLVELRREQYTLRDSYQTRIKKESVARGMPIEDSPIFTFDCDAPVYPLGLFSQNSIQKNIFKPIEELIPQNFTEEELKGISKNLWNRVDNAIGINFDFRELEHVYELFQIYLTMRESENLEHYNSTTNFLFKTLEYYIEMAELTDAQKEILDLKIKKVKNQDIAALVNKKYQKSYTANYISTIFRQKIIKQINDAAAFHEKVVSNLFFPEEFKKCTCCGKVKLICSENFVKKSRSKDGYTNRCKDCDKKDRLSKKENKNG